MYVLGSDLAAVKLGEERLHDTVVDGVLDEDDRNRHFEEVDAPGFGCTVQGFRV